MKNNMISRRGFLRKAVGTAAAATVAGMAAGCSAASQAPASSSEAARQGNMPGSNYLCTASLTTTQKNMQVTLPPKKKKNQPTYQYPFKKKTPYTPKHPPQ